MSRSSLDQWPRDLLRLSPEAAWLRRAAGAGVEFATLCGIRVLFIYAMRRVECPYELVQVEPISIFTVHLSVHDERALGPHVRDQSPSA